MRYDTPTNKGTAAARPPARQGGCTPNQIALAFPVNHGFPVIPFWASIRSPNFYATRHGRGDVKLTPQQIHQFARRIAGPIPHREVVE